MNVNVGKIDRIIRIVLFIILVSIGVILFTGTTDITVQVLAGVFALLGVVMLVTSAISFCPIYAIFGLSTCPTKN